MPDDLETDFARAELTGHSIETILGIGHRKGAKTIGAGDRHDSSTVLDPDRRFVRTAGALTSGKLMDQVRDFVEQSFGFVLSLREERIAQDTLRDAQVGKLARDHDDRNGRKTAAHHRQKLKATHVGHAQIGDDDVRHGLFERDQSLEAVSRRDDLIPLRLQQKSADVANARIVVYDQDAV